MSGGVNKWIGIGNLGDEPSMRYTANGSAVTSFRMACSHTVDKKEFTEWVSVVTWNKLAELCGQYLDKGRKVYVEGRLQTRSWDDKGTKKYKTEIVANQVVFLDKGTGGNGSYDPDEDGGIDADDLPFE